MAGARFVAFTWLARDEANLRAAVLAASTRLLDVPALAFGGTRQHPLVADLRSTDARLNLELTFETVDDDLEASVNLIQVFSVSACLRLSDERAAAQPRAARRRFLGLALPCVRFVGCSVLILSQPSGSTHDLLAAER